MSNTTILKELLTPFTNVPPEFDCPISGLSSDSRSIQSGDLFIALNGYQQDGRQFIKQAIQKGAVAILCEKSAEFPATAILENSLQQKIPLIIIDSLEEKIGKIAAKFYDYPSKKLNVIGVTGTNGKTSCTQWIAYALSRLNHPCAVIGTLGYGFPDNLTKGAYTTPFPIEIQKMSAAFYQQGASCLAMEVASHALAQHRVAGVQFKIGIFTNLSHDHLDYHGNLQAYALAKKKLFDSPLEYRVFNLDDAYGKAWFTEYQAQKGCYGYSITPNAYNLISKDALIYASKIAFSEKGIHATIHTPWGSGILESQLLGSFNLSNLLAVLTSLCLLGIPLKEALNIVPSLNTPPGRMQMLGGNGRPKIVIDYAHTPHALEQALKSLRLHCHGKLWCVFGCGGNRDKAKRPIMGKIAEKYADYAIVTSDNPRHENANEIIEQIVSGLAVNSTAIIDPDRHIAIAHAISCAKPEDMVLIAGKGHELYQQVGDENLPFSDLAEAQLALDAWKNPC